MPSLIFFSLSCRQLTVIGAGTSGSTTIDWNQTWLDSEERKAVEARIAGTDGQALLVPPELHGQVPEAGKRAASRRTQLRYNIMRMYRRYWRLPAYNFTRLATMLFFACLLGLALLQIVNFSNDGNTQEASSLIPGAAFLSILPGTDGPMTLYPDDCHTAERCCACFGLCLF